MTNHPMLPRTTEAGRSPKDRIPVAGSFSLCALTLTSLLGGCAAIDPQSNVSIERSRPIAISAASYSMLEAPRIQDEILLFDTGMLREIRRPQPYRDALSLTDPKKKALIIAGTIIGVYLIDQWLEDNLPLPPGP